MTLLVNIDELLAKVPEVLELLEYLEVLECLEAASRFMENKSQPWSELLKLYETKVFYEYISRVTYYQVRIEVVEYK